MTGLLSWLDDPRTDRGIRFSRPDGSWQSWSYARLAGLARARAADLLARGVAPGDVVGVVLPTGPDFVGTLFGALLAGATASPLAPPATFGDPDRYTEHVAAALTVMRPRLVVVDTASAAALSGVAARAAVPVVDVAQLSGEAAPGGAMPPTRLALLQFTSGTTGTVRGVRVPYPALEANVAAIRRWLEMTPDDPTASWLPVHHDMGLVGCLLAPIVTGADLWLLTPAEFVRRPTRFLECFGRHGARLTAMPGFGLAHVVRRVRAEQLAGLDFTHWRAIIAGAERIQPATLDSFADLLGPYGLRREALLPAYGLAEATLAVTGLPLGTGWRQVPGPDGVPVVGCGVPLAGTEVTVVDDDARPVGDGVVGEILVGGAAVTDGYAGGPTFPGARVRTGDAGFARDGELFVLGRLGDSLKVHGRTVFAEDVDALLGAALGVPPGRLASVLGLRAGTPVVVVYLEHPRPEWLPRIPGLVRPLVPQAAVHVVPTPAGSVPRTTSGKPKRRLLWRRHLTEPAPATPVNLTADRGSG
ncbi:fatty acyl-AMP ligase [Micromonospora sp. HNM0581]|uniref:AMP-binding protein n=1 Tax=Micromonospora sp. HNM0581 TaxID=2716341 RepID=UPI00146E5900|nr:AMP-binding protein [Micromonospora sp. HNM0581]NLU78260.1 fatty acyl-AMP ligase [Micromonospora sp. HNM0581]